MVSQLACSGLRLHLLVPGTTFNLKSHQASAGTLVHSKE